RPTDSICCSRTIPSRSRNGSPWSSPSCSGAASSAPNTKARPSARISACRSRGTSSPGTARACRSRPRRRPMTERMLRLGGFFSVPGNHLAGWRHPDAVPTYDMDFQGYAHITQVAEAAKFDCIFFQDTVGVAGSRQLARGERARSKLSRTVKLEPTATLAALAMVTERIGLVATATTTYNEPYNIARRFMSIDHISDGRAGWNLVTSQIEDESENFGFDEHLAHADRYERAAEFYEVVTGLWDSWEDGCLLRDKKSGVYMDREKVHFLDHVGKHFKVKGPLNITRSPQGWPVVAQAGSSEAGRELAARTADVVFTAQTKID